MNVEDFKLLVEACKSIEIEEKENAKGRKRYPRSILYALVYLSITNKWSIRECEKWSLKNFHVLKEVGWRGRNPPKKSTIHMIMKDVDASILQKIRHLKEKRMLRLLKT